MDRNITLFLQINIYTQRNSNKNPNMIFQQSLTILILNSQKKLRLKNSQNYFEGQVRGEQRLALPDMEMWKAWYWSYGPGTGKTERTEGIDPHTNGNLINDRVALRSVGGKLGHSIMCQDIHRKIRETSHHHEKYP